MNSNNGRVSAISTATVPLRAEADCLVRLFVRMAFSSRLGIAAGMTGNSHSFRGTGKANYSIRITGNSAAISRNALRNSASLSA